MYFPSTGGKRTDTNGEVVEELLEGKNMVCLNDGRGTRINVHTGNTSLLDLTLVSSNLAGICEWDVSEETSIGSDHFPIVCKILMQRDRPQTEGLGKWVFNRTRWDMFEFICEREIGEIDLNGDTEEIEGKFKDMLFDAAKQTISRSKGKMKRKAVPWWTDECGEVVKERNKALRVLRRTHHFQN